MYAAGMSDLDSDSPFPSNPSSLNYTSITLIKVRSKDFFLCHRIENVAADHHSACHCNTFAANNPLWFISQSFKHKLLQIPTRLWVVLFTKQFLY